MYADTEGHFGQASGMPYSRLYELRGRDITNFQDKIERLRREGIRLSPKLEWDAFVTAYTLHDEVPLHSYPRRIMPLMRQLREQEERARANISEFDPSTFDKNDAAEELQFRFTTNASLIGDLYLVYIREALTAHEKEILTAEEKCNLYYAAAALQTLVDIWDEAQPHESLSDPRRPVETNVAARCSPQRGTHLPGCGAPSPWPPPPDNSWLREIAAPLPTHDLTLSSYPAASDKSLRVARSF